MKPAPLVVDTNVVVAGVLTSDRQAPTARILDALLAGRLPFLLSETLLAEYRAVLLRPKIRARHGLSAREVDVILLRLVENALLREPEPAGAVAGDEHLFALLALDRRALLVSGDAAALRRAADRGRAPRALAEELGIDRA